MGFIPRVATCAHERAEPLARRVWVSIEQLRDTQTCADKVTERVQARQPRQRLMAPRDNGARGLLARRGPYIDAQRDELCLQARELDRGERVRGRRDGLFSLAQASWHHRTLPA